MANSQYEGQEFDYQFDNARRDEKGRAPRSTTQRRAQYSRTNRPVVMHNGIHRRRNKRFAW